MFKKSSFTLALIAATVMANAQVANDDATIGKEKCSPTGLHLEGVYQLMQYAPTEQDLLACKVELHTPMSMNFALRGRTNYVTADIEEARTALDDTSPPVNVGVYFSPMKITQDLPTVHALRSAFFALDLANDEQMLFSLETENNKRYVAVDISSPDDERRLIRMALQERPRGLPSLKIEARNAFTQRIVLTQGGESVSLPVVALLGDNRLNGWRYGMLETTGATEREIDNLMPVAIFTAQGARPVFDF
jgi:hypothetical protein